MAHLLMLPDEVKIKIFEYLNGVDKVELLKVCEDLHRVGVDREVIQCLNFSNNYKTNLAHIKFIARKATCHLVTELNLNTIHWIPSAQLRDTLCKFLNLTALHVIDTQLSYRDLAVVVNTSKVTKLAMSLRPDNCADVFKISINVPLKHLYVTYNSYSIRSLMKLMSQFDELEELWLIEYDIPFNININEHFEFPWQSYTESPLPKVLKRIVINRQYHKIPEKDFLIASIKAGTSNWIHIKESVFGEKVFIVLEKFEDQHPSNMILNIDNNFEENLLRIQKDFGMTNLFCVTDIRHLLINKLSYNELKFTCLNLIRQNIKNDLDINSCLKTFETVLFSENMKFLHRIKTEPFVFCDIKESNEEKVTVSLFKKRRTGLVSKSVDESSIFARFTKHATEIEDFEILDEDDNRKMGDKNFQIINSLKFIKNWKILKKLTITSDCLINGKFLIEITKNCPMINCLKIKDGRVQDSFTSDLCEALRFAENLKDLRYERKGGIVAIDQLFESLTNCQYLERLYVQCLFASKMSKKPLETVITRSENLMFLFIFISELPENVCKTIKKSIKGYNVQPQQIITIRGQSYVLDNIIYEDIPATHVADIVCQSNNFNCDFLRSFSH